MSKKTSDRKHRFDGRTDPDRAIREVVEWAKRMRDQRKLADSKAPRFFLGYEQKDFRSEASVRRTHGPRPRNPRSRGVGEAHEGPAEAGRQQSAALFPGL